MTHTFHNVSSYYRRRMGPPQILDHLLLPFFHFNIMLLRPTVSPLTGSEASV